MNVTIIGGGVIGLNCAYYLQKKGFQVTVIDKGELKDGCSFGNMGYISPSHFVPLASPGIIAQGLKWMLSPSSPFYIRPRFSLDLLRWGISFWRSATKKHVQFSMPHLNNLLQLTRHLMTDLKEDLAEPFDLTENGCWMLWKNEKTGDHEKHLAEQAEIFGLKTVVVSGKEVQQYETDVEVNVSGGILYLDDCYVNPARFMLALLSHLEKKGVSFWINSPVTGFETANGKITAVLTGMARLQSDEVIVANGSWMGQISKLLGIYIPMQPGKGYSMVYEGLEKNLRYPSILVDDRTATTPIKDWLRIGGTMELSGHNGRILPKRVMSIHQAFKKYYPSMNLPEPEIARAWYGYRPVSPDGMPYIGRHPAFSNLSFAGGHAMLGVSTAAGTGKLIEEIICQKQPSFPIYAFDPARFHR